MEEVAASLRSLIKPAGVVMIGEWHGTNEFPLLVEHVVGRAKAEGFSVVVGLEIPCSEQAAIDTLANTGGGVSGPWWDRAEEFRDGRSSQAMARLVSTLAAMAKADAAPTINTVAMDGPWVAPGSAIPMELLHLVEAPRDETMARHLLDAMDAGRQAFTLVLAGSEHTRIGAADDGRPTLGRYVSQWHPHTVALLGRSSGGQAWGLRQSRAGRGAMTSGPFPVPDDAELSPGAQWADQVGPDGHHGYVHVGAVTPSPPLDPPPLYQGDQT